jgi:hypothetical protein
MTPQMAPNLWTAQTADACSKPCASESADLDVGMATWLWLLTRRSLLLRNRVAPGDSRKARRQTREWSRVQKQENGDWCWSKENVDLVLVWLLLELRQWQDLHLVDFD